ncbi:hypothetical protein LJR220_003322 [Bradyrhizobium sp. LjRoot220]|uniref:hypothetical protein n=1 Tax=Bradyrhizobium sp. LjRoot220 TaxID=3342284 RepID=UPI003ED044B0
MTYKISKTILDRQNLGDFAARAATFAVEMKRWREHMARVAKDEAGNVPVIDRHMPYPRPREHELVEAAVNENDEMAYELVDDGPKPEEILATKKQELAAVVFQMERAAAQAILPEGKRRLQGMRYNDIKGRDAVVAAEVVGEPSLLKNMAAAVGLKKRLTGDDIKNEIESRRPADDTSFLQDYEIRLKRIAAIERRTAEIHDAIEDLTLDNVDAYQIPDFTKED